MKKIIGILIITCILLGGLSTPILARTAKTSLSIQELIQSLRQQIETLYAMVVELQSELNIIKQKDVKEETKEVKETLKLLRYLQRGMTGEDVELLQEILSTDSEIYPEGLVTGFFGPLTEKAVKRFQKKAAIEQVGVVGPKTTSKLNEILAEGAGSSGKVPPGLLIAPGIRKKLGYAPEPLPGQELPPGIAKKLGEEEEEEEDTMAPVISGLQATSTTATTTEISWLTDEEANSKVWYDILTPIVVATSTLAVESSDLVLNHNLVLSDLTASTTYYYLVTSGDAADNTATSSELFFTTLP